MVPSSASRNETHLALRSHCPSSSMASSTADQVALIKEATRGIEKLLNNDLQGAQELLSARPQSPGHGVGLGICGFLQAALGQEDNELAAALDVLLKAEGIATAQSSKKGEKGVFPAGLEYKVSCRSFCIYISIPSRIIHRCSSCCTTFLKKPTADDCILARHHRPLDCPYRSSRTMQSCRKLSYTSSQSLTCRSCFLLLRCSWEKSRGFSSGFVR